MFALIFGVAVLYSECLLIEAMHGVLYEIEGPSETDPLRWNLPEPFPDSPPTVESSLKLFNQGLKVDPCRSYCFWDVKQSAVLQDCGEIVEAMVFLAQNNHPRVKAECADAKEHMCKSVGGWMSLKYACFVKLTVVVTADNSESGRKSKWFFLKRIFFDQKYRRRHRDKYFSLRDCIDSND